MADARAGPTALDVAAKVTDFAIRLRDKAEVLEGMARERDGQLEGVRLAGKAEGVRLALSFVDELHSDILREVATARHGSVGPETSTDKE